MCRYCPPGDLCLTCKRALAAAKDGIVPAGALATSPTPRTSGELQLHIFRELKRHPEWGYRGIYHTVDSRRSRKGFLDLELVRPRTRPTARCAPRPARFIKAELKNDGEPPTREQQEWMEVYWMTGPWIEVYCWQPQDEQEIYAILSAESLSARSAAWMARCRWPLTIAVP